MERQTMTVGFADLSHYTRVVEHLGDEGAIALLDRAFLAAGDVIVGCGGQIDKYIGDAMLFHFPQPHAAVQAANAIVNGFCFKEDELIVRWSVALATGEVIRVEIGHPSHRTHDILGATVNRAGKLLKEAHRAPARIAMCDETRRLIG